VGRLVEAELSSGLEAYLCDNRADYQLLRPILEQAYAGHYQPKIIISRFLQQPHNVKRVASAAYPLLMDLVEVSHPVVFNYLVDLFSIEAVLVCPGQKEALDITLHMDRVPTGLRYCISHDFYKFFPASRDSDFRSYYIREKAGGGGRLQASARQRITNQLEQVKAW
jgi:hypothetical protein